MKLIKINLILESKIRGLNYPERSEGSSITAIKYVDEVLRLKPQDSFCRETNFSGKN
jgi:hypothetical protein